MCSEVGSGYVREGLVVAVKASARSECDIAKVLQPKLKSFIPSN